MKLFSRLALLLVGLAIISSCSEDDFDRNPILNIDEVLLTFTKDAGEKSVAVDFNESDKLFFTGVSDWMNITTTTEGFNVSVQANDTFDARETTITVRLQKGSPTKEVTITQAPGGEAYINVSEDNLKFPYKSGELSVFVDANVEWTLSTEGEGDWLTIDDSKIDKNIITLAVIENSDNIRRIAKLTLAGSGEETIVTVTQRGTMYYDFPIVQLGYIYEGAESERGYLYPISYLDAHMFEKARGSVANRSTPPIYYYTSQSPIFSLVMYVADNWGGPEMPSVRWAGMDSSEDLFEILKDPIFLEYLEEEGYELAWRDDAKFVATYWNKKTQVALQCFGVGADRPDASLTFIHSKVKPNNPASQINSYPTYDAMPAFFVEEGATMDQIRAWEAEKGSKSIPSGNRVDMLSFAPDPVKEPNVIERVYYMDMNTTPATLSRTLILLNNTEKALYPTGYSTEWLANAASKEFKGLMLDGGFTYDQKIDNSSIWIFHNSAQKLSCMMAIRYFQSEGFIPRLVMEIAPVID